MAKAADEFANGETDGEMGRTMLAQGFNEPYKAMINQIDDLTIQSVHENVTTESNTEI